MILLMLLAGDDGMGKSSIASRAVEQGDRGQGLVLGCTVKGLFKALALDDVLGHVINLVGSTCEARDHMGMLFEYG